MTTFASALLELAQADLVPNLTQDEELHIDATLTDHLDAQMQILATSGVDGVKRSLLLRSVAHLVALLNEMPKDDANSSAASTTVATDERSALAPEFCDRASSEHMGWPTQVASLAASSLAPVPEASPVASRIVLVAVSAQLAERAANFQLGTRWLGGPLVWQLTDRTEPQPFLSQQRCIVLSGGEAGYAANARTMRDSSTRGHIDVIFPIADYKAIVGDLGETYDLVKPLYASRKEGTAYRLRSFCPPDHVTLDEMDDEPHPHGQCANLESLNRTLVQSSKDMMCTITMRANVNVRYRDTEDEEYFVGVKVETMRVHAYVPRQEKAAHGLAFALHKSSTLLM